MSTSPSCLTTLHVHTTILPTTYSKAASPFHTRPVWGMDLQVEHERHLAAHVGGAVAVTDYPATLKPFYMRRNADGATVAAADVLVPRIGELVGGSQREEREAVCVMLLLPCPAAQ
jgi:asparaginyl-tRNA synthetase